MYSNGYNNVYEKKGDRKRRNRTQYNIKDCGSKKARVAAEKNAYLRGELDMNSSKA